ncbi:TVP38/TMEM64 family protein [Salinibacterium sp. NG22]|uniref:TVP38/TMEM64 family protein n=1 Tax=Salinibacterium sp. NG22 TaxID=2792040 RepID=UPI0018CC9441|nr:TVP38/TMEM64 family protein [Salinibacterium sp. NG22]MBH0110093.1 TVP38/TMEM64 family protein [Salinibacterium sp. NG22]
MTKPRTSTLWRAGVLLVIFVAIVVVALTVQLPSVDEIHEWTQSAGSLGIALFVIGYALLTLTPIPKSVLSMAGGVAWGLWVGTLIVLIGALIGATLSFWLGRVLGRDAVEHFTGGRVRAVDEMLQRRGLLSVIALRLIPVLPFTLINYAAGLTAVRIRDYALGTVIGIIPGTFAYVAVGAYGAELNSGFYIAVGALGVLALGGVIIAHRIRKDDSAPEEVVPEQAAPEQA